MAQEATLRHTHIHIVAFPLMTLRTEQIIGGNRIGSQIQLCFQLAPKSALSYTILSRITYATACIYLVYIYICSHNFYYSLYTRCAAIYLVVVTLTCASTNIYPKILKSQLDSQCAL